MAGGRRATTTGQAVAAVVMMVDRAAHSKHRRWIGSAVGLVFCVIGQVAAGPVTAVLLAAYATAAVTLYLRRRVRRHHAQSRSHAIDAVAGLAADVRAGAGVVHVTDAVRVQQSAAVGSPARAVTERLACAVAVADDSGAPLADVLDRLDDHLRAMDRADASAKAQAAGVRASAVLLAVLPVAGIGLGSLLGVDAGRVLLHTPFGGACLIGAAALQLVGLAWSARISRFEVPV